MLVHVQKAPQNACLKNEIDQIKINYNNKSKILDQLFCSIPSHKSSSRWCILPYHHYSKAAKQDKKILFTKPDIFNICIFIYWKL